MLLIIFYLIAIIYLIFSKSLNMPLRLIGKIYIMHYYNRLYLSKSLIRVIIFNISIISTK